MFLEWSLSNGWQKGLQFDRINNNCHYEPSNCRFVTSKINNRNRRTNRLITYKNKTSTISEWSEITGINKTTLMDRLNRNWSIEKSLTKKIFI